MHVCLIFGRNLKISMEKSTVLLICTLMHALRSVLKILDPFIVIGCFHSNE